MKDKKTREIEVTVKILFGEDGLCALTPEEIKRAARLFGVSAAHQAERQITTIIEGIRAASLACQPDA